MIREYIKIDFLLESALSIGSGENNNTDKDIVKDSLGRPFIPGTSLAGVYRSLFNEEDAKKYFGEVKISTNEDNASYASNSLIKVYDATTHANETTISERDCVGLDDYKVAIPGAKFDFEVVDAGIKFTTYIEQKFENEEDKNIIEEIVTRWKKEGLCLGAKTCRGLGYTKIENIYFKKFYFPDDIDAWLNFDMYGDAWDDFSVKDNKQNSDIISIKLSLIQTSGISIKEYTTDVSNDDKAYPDYRQLVRKDENGEYAIVPGTSWAGAFRHHMKKLGLKENELKEVFGSVDSHKSLISFSESQIRLGNKEGEGKKKIVSRNAINRFTGGAVNKALYTEEYIYGGKTELTIKLPKNTDTHIKKILAAAICDLHNGFLSIGGLTAVGRGMFKVDELNDALISGYIDLEKIMQEELI